MKRHTEGVGGDRWQSGFGIVEMMVSLTIGLLLLGGVAQIFQGSRTSERLQNGLGEMYENARFVLDTVARDIARTGYKEARSEDAGFFESSILDNSYSLAGLGMTSAAGTANDLLAIQYTGTRGCTGTSLSGSILHIYYVTQASAAQSESGVLWCRDNSGAQVLADYIDALQFLYGVDDDNDLIPNRYVTATEVGTDDWPNVRAVRMAIMVSTPATMEETDNGKYALLDIPLLENMGGNVTRRVFTRTILIRNLDW